MKKKTFKIGLKLWSTNLNYIKPALDLYEKRIFDYIELFCVPDSYNDFIEYWTKTGIPYVIHGPHFQQGMNLSIADRFINNKKLFEESALFANALKSDIIILHSGANGNLDETINQLIKLNDLRIVIENKPFYGLNNEFCIGYSPQEILKIMNEVGINFCLDFGHAVCAANALKKDPINFINELNKLNPVIYHLTDGDYNTVYDQHFNYGKGSFPIKKMLEFIPDMIKVTNESKKNSTENLDDFIEDIKIINSF